MAVMPSEDQPRDDEDESSAPADLLPGIHFIALRALSRGTLTATLSTCEGCGTETQECLDRPCEYRCPCGFTTQIILPSWLPTEGRSNAGARVLPFNPTTED